MYQGRRSATQHSCRLHTRRRGKSREHYCLQGPNLNVAKNTHRREWLQQYTQPEQDDWFRNEWQRNAAAQENMYAVY